ncbi:MAG: carboxypeptidase-like regulatory domain-containing protein [Perlabentimonas sp.]
MRKIFLLILFVVSLSSSLFAQAVRVTGTVTQEANGDPIPGALIKVKGTSIETLSDAEGLYSIEVPRTATKLTCSFEEQTEEVLIEGRSSIDFVLDLSDDSEDPDDFVPVITLSTNDFDGGDGEMHDISGLLQGSRDIFLSTAGYTFGSARFRVRGYDSENSTVLINGVRVNDPETGRAYYSSWGGLNDAMRNTVNTIGLEASEVTYGGVGGTNNIITRASEYRPQTKVTYSAANRSYRNRVMFIHSTGMVDDEWAMTISGSKRWAQEGYAEGTFYDAYAYFFSAERKFTDNHSFGFTAFGAPMRSGRSGIAVQEAFDLTDNPYYNPNWGYQDGEVRNARVNNYHTPMMLLTHYGTFDNTTVNTTISYAFGRAGNTALNWYNTADPRPDYYRYLPSFYEGDDFQYNSLKDQWQNDPQQSQLNWDYFYFANAGNLYSAPGDIEGDRSKYVVEERRNDKSHWTLNSTARHWLDDRTILTGGINVSLYKGFQFKEMVDLLGGDWWIDVDQFAERDSDDEDFYQNDLDNPNRLIQEGDRFGYDFTANINEMKAFAQSEFEYTKVDFFVAANVSHTSFWRTGHMRNGRFPDNSYGDSEKHNFLNFGVKGGATYKITGRHYLDFNASYSTRAPYFRNAYISSRVRDHVVEGISSDKILTGDMSYIVRTPNIKSRATVYYSEFKDQTWNRSFYHEGYRTFINYIMTDVNTMNLGAELGVDVNVTPDLSLNAVGAWGHYVYSSRPNVTIARDNDLELLAEDRTVYFENYRVGGFPQAAASLGARYNSPKYWFAGTNVNYFGKSYIDPNPDRRTEDAVAAFDDSDIRVDEVLEQQTLNDGFTLDVYAGKSWRIQRKYFIRVNLSVSNVLNNQDLTVVAFEQLRYDPQDIDRFPPKYAYMYGTNFFLNVNFSF